MLYAYQKNCGADLSYVKFKIGHNECGHCDLTFNAGQYSIDCSIARVARCPSLSRNLTERDYRVLYFMLVPPLFDVAHAH